MIKVGIIGYRKIASQTHFPCYRKLQNAKVTHIADSSENRLNKAKKNERCEGYFQDYRELLETKDIDVVDICTQSTLTPQLCIETAKSGKSFLVEPPFAFTVQAAKEIRNAVEKIGVKACIAQPYRFKPAIYPITLKHQLGEFGRIFSISVTAFELSPRLNPKIDPIFRLPEAIDALTFFGGKVKKVFAKALTLFNDPEGLLEPEIRALIEFENNCAGFLIWSGYAPAKDFTIHVYGTGFAVRMNVLASSNEVLNWWWEPGPRLTAIKDTFANVRTFFKKNPHIVESGYLQMISKFLDSVENDTESPVPFDDGVKLIALIEGLKKSVSEGVEVNVDIS
jgi:UDP-N-acetyl-2-amino-2-deoxyglucuronate dehydrogenase